MLRNVIMPTLGLDMEEATIQTWLKREGEQVSADEPLLVVETDKASVEIGAPATGILRQILHLEGSVVPVTQPIAIIETPESSDVAGTARSMGAAPVVTRPEPVESADLPRVARPLPVGPVRASPAARRIARETGVPLDQVSGSGPDGRIQGEDVRRFVAQSGRPDGQVAARPAGRLIPLGRKRRLTAERMALSARVVARVTFNMEIDATALVTVRAEHSPEFAARFGVRLSYNDLLVWAAARALEAHGELNSRWTDQGIYVLDAINIGLAVAVEDGLVVPVIRDAHRKSLAEISAELAQLTTKAREDRLAVEEMSGGTFTVTNLGMFGIDSFTPLVNPPETAILGVGRITERPVGSDGRVVLRPTMNLSLSVDHRAVDGAPAARFLQALRGLLESPQNLH